MNSRALIDETLKYLETDENKKPKYSFSVYTVGAKNYLKEQISTLSFGLVNTTQEDEEKTPVSVYTIGDVFDTISETKNEVMGAINALPTTLENVKISLKQLGYTALDKVIDTIKTAVIPIEIIQTVESIYRIAKPLVEKIVNIASIRFHFENAALVAQDVLQYISRLAVSTAKTYLSRLWDIFMDTPIFAVYENGQTEELLEAYATFSDAADQLMDELTNNTKFDDIVNYINGPEKLTYEPKYDNLGIVVDDDITDIYSNPSTRKIYIATKNVIYKLNEDYTTTELFKKDNASIDRVYEFNDDIYYISYAVNENTVTSSSVYKAGNDEPVLASPGKIEIIFSNPILLYVNNQVYTAAGTAYSGLTLPGNIKYQCYNIDNDVIYCDIEENNVDKIYMFNKDSAGTYHQEFLDFVAVPVYGMNYFNGMLYLMLCNDGKYYFEKINAGLAYDRDLYSFINSKTQNNIIYVNDTDNYATDSQNIYSINNSNLTYLTKSNDINCITKQTYESKNYLVCSGGTNLYVSEIPETSDYDYSWNSKAFNTYDDYDELLPPDNIAGCLWATSNYGTNFIAYSQERIYLFGPDKISQIFSIDEASEGEKMISRKQASFSQWFKDSKKKTDNVVYIDYSSKINLEEGCIITTMKVVDGKLYVGIYNPIYSEINNLTKCGIYPVKFTKKSAGRRSSTYTLVIDYGHPVFSTEKLIKIYSFNKIDNVWYYTNGETLFNITYSSETNLELDSPEIADRALSIASDKSIYTAKSKMTPISEEDTGDVESLVSYESISPLKVGTTRNVFMASDGEHIYNIINNGEDKINYDLFQICYSSKRNYNIIQSNDAVFITSGSILKRIPYYSELASINYGCGYYTDTTLNKWFGAAPYYFASNVLKANKNSKQREEFLMAFSENFKVELEKLLKNVPDAFINYTKDRLVEKLKETGVKIEGDDGQIANLILNSVANTTATSLGMYIQEAFFKKIGDDSTYETFSKSVYNACLNDTTNNMTKDFYDVFEQLYDSTFIDGVIKDKIGEEGLAEALLKYYQNHKAEWAKSMTVLIDVDVVKPRIYEVPLVDTVIPVNLTKKTYRFSYPESVYEFEYIANPESKYLSDNIIDGYYRNGIFKINNEDIVEGKNYYTYNSTTEEYEPIDYSDIKIYYTRTGSGTEQDPYVYEIVNDNSQIDTDHNTYYVYNNDEYTEADPATISKDTYYVFDSNFYKDPEYTEIIDPKFKNDDGDYVDENEEIVCYYNKDDGKYYRYKAREFELTTDTSVVSDKTYFEKTGTDGGEPTYVPATETSDDGTIQYYSEGYGESADTSVISGKTYYEKVESELEYSRPTQSDYNQDGSLKQNEYYEKEDYRLTSDIEIDENKTYYTESIIPATGEVSNTKQYYEITYAPTADLRIDPEKVYYEAIDLSPFVGEDIYNYVGTGGQYSVTYSQVPEGSEIDKDETYYTRTGAGTVLDPYIYTIEYDVDEQKGPYFIVDGVDAGSEYEKVTVPAGASINYSQVISPIASNLENYYEQQYSEIPTPESISEKFVKEFVAVEEPVQEELSDYYEESGEYILSTNVNYVYDEDGSVYGIVDDRVFYKATFNPDAYSEVEPSADDNPVQEGWYEIIYTPVELGTSLNPANEGLFKRTSNEIEYTEVENPTGNPSEHGWYENNDTFSIIYDDKKLYIALNPERVPSKFPVEDDAWHKIFYSYVAEAKAAVEAVTSEDVEVIRAEANRQLNMLQYIIYPSWIWQELITISVTNLYIPEQSEHYKQIIRNSNMYPIQWDELPSDINHEAFDYALTALLYAIKQRLLTDVSILVDNGKIKCYSCVDASSVIKKMVEGNGNIWYNQIRAARTDVNKATAKNEILSAFNMDEAFNLSLVMLENILNQQSALYAKYMDMIIEEQIINDNETEVSL